ncbi:MAG: hypothetical protein R6X33_02205 [Candidatus Brocadiia bacterium]
MMKGSFRWTGVAILVVALLVAGTARAAEQDAPRSAETELRRVALFKNGLGYYVSSVTLPEGDAREFALEVPLEPAHGTFWVTHPDDVALEEVIASKVTRPVEQQAQDIRGLLRGNVGKRLRVHLSSPGEEPVEGRLIYAPGAGEAVGPGQFAFDSRLSALAAAERAGSGFCVLDAEEGQVLLTASAVQRVEFPDSDASLTYVEDEEAVRMRGRLAAPAPGRDLTVSYLAKGITWAPSYVVDVSEPEEAAISAKALIINEGVDLEGAEVSLVTGFPNLGWADVVTPMALTESLSNFLRRLGESDEQRERRMRRRGGTFTGQIGGGDVGLPFDPDEFLARAPMGEVEDLFLYPVDGVAVGEGEVGYYPLFSASVPYEHIHQWDIPDHVDAHGSYASAEDLDKAEVVWHSLRLTNTTDVPWTTAPGQTVSRNQILGQDMLRYTPVGGRATLRVTQAMGVKAQQVEYEVERERNAVSFHGTSYDRVTLTGELTVTNFKKDDVKLEITKLLSGELQSADGEPELRKLARGLRRVNPRGRLRWTIELQPGRQEELTYTYEVYLR